MKINCLSCGHNIDVGDAYDNYEGEIKCFICGGISEIKTEEGQIKEAVKITKIKPQDDEYTNV